MFAAELTNDAISAIQAVAITLVGAWVAIRTRGIDARMRGAARRNKLERERCDRLEHRVHDLEGRLAKFRAARKPKRPPKPKTGR